MENIRSIVYSNAGCGYCRMSQTPAGSLIPTGPGVTVTSVVVKINPLIVDALADDINVISSEGKDP
jgi:hypothetical protein